MTCVKSAYMYRYITGNIEAFRIFTEQTDSKAYEPQNDKEQAWV